MRLLAQFLHALLAGDRLARSLAGTRVGAGALPADRKAATVAQATVTADLAEAAEFAPEVMELYVTGLRLAGLPEQ